MNNNKKKVVTRSNFLKTSGIMLGSFAMLPSSTLKDLISFDKLIADGMKDFQIVIPAKTGNKFRQKIII